MGTLFAVLAGIVIGVSVSGHGEDLCKRMGGSYTPNAYGAESCPGGSWANVFKPR